MVADEAGHDAATSLLGAPRHRHHSSLSDSSLPNSARLTPDSDTSSDIGHGHGINFGIGGDAETYELQDRTIQESSSCAIEMEDDDDDDSDDDEKIKDDEDEGHHDLERGPRPRRTSVSSIASFQLYTREEERAVVRKFDRRLVMFLAVCYMVSFIDRANIGNARIAGMEDDLQTRPPQPTFYEWALTSFYVAYVAFEWMSLLWRLIPAHVYVSLIVLSWGVISSLQAVAPSYPVLIFLRALLGIGEAGFTGVPFYLSFFFKRHELAFRTAIFISAAPLATTFASSLAWLILKVAENGPIAPWRLLFLLEGFPSVIIATIAWSVIPDTPDSATYLTARERRVARLRLRREKVRQKNSHATATTSPPGRPPPSSSSSSLGLKLRDVLSSFADPNAWLTAFMFFLTNMAYSSLPVFLPTILTEMGYTALQAQALTAPPYLVSFLTVLATARLSDRHHSRAPFVALPALASAAGYAVLALAEPLRVPPLLRYLAVYPAAAGFFNVVVVVLAWSINNEPTTERAGGSGRGGGYGYALLQAVGQCGPLVGTRLYPDADAPYFAPGMWACALAMAAVAALAFLLRCYLARRNRELDAGDGRPDPEGTEGTEEEARGLVGSGAGGERRRREVRDGFRFML
ncbi:major facilitator superfamily domain-containing protein [Biscogniauxia mediterranea]|nr:major facilitator superfamily domain-containing protein [Biscogniauxia mediterranea]